MPERSDPPDSSTCGQRVRRALRESSFGLALALASSAAAIENRPAWLPDPQLTPGAFAESSTAAICVRGYDRAHRVWHDKAGTLARYQIAPAEAALYEDDDLIPGLSRRRQRLAAQPLAAAARWRVGCGEEGHA